MKKRIIKGTEVQRSSGNVYADLGLPDAEKLKIKSGLVIEIRKAMRRLDLTQQAAAKRMGITQPKVSDMMRGDLSNLSERKLMDCLNRLGYDIEIKVKPAAKRVGVQDFQFPQRDASTHQLNCLPLVNMRPAIALDERAPEAPHLFSENR